MPAYVIQGPNSALGDEPVAGNRQYVDRSLLTHTERLRCIEVGMRNISAHQPGRYIPTQTIKQGYALVNGQWKEIWPNPKPDINDMYWRTRRPYGRDAHDVKPPNEWGGGFMIWGGSERMVIYTFNKPMHRGITHVEVEAHINEGFPGNGTQLYVAARDPVGNIIPGLEKAHTDVNKFWWGNGKGDRGYRTTGKLAIDIPAGASICVVVYRAGGDSGDGVNYAWLRLKNIWWEGDDEPTVVTNNP